MGSSNSSVGGQKQLLRVLVTCRLGLVSSALSLRLEMFPPTVSNTRLGRRRQNACKTLRHCSPGSWMRWCQRARGTSPVAAWLKCDPSNLEATISPDNSSIIWGSKCTLLRVQCVQCCPSVTRSSSYATSIDYKAISRGHPEPGFESRRRKRVMCDRNSLRVICGVMSVS
jgi:hypothetical protein